MGAAGSVPPVLLRGLIAACCLLGAATAHAGAWTRDPGSYYVRAGLSALLPGDGYFNGDRKRRSVLDASYRELSAGVHGEVGVLDRLTALAGFSFWHVNLGADVDDDRGDTSFTAPGHGSIGARYRFIDEPFLLAFQGEAKIAVNRDEDPAPHRWGDGRDEARIVAVGSRSFGPTWVSMELGTNLRMEEPAHQIVYLAQAGRWFGPAALALDLDGAESLRETPDDATLGGEYSDVTNPLLETVVADAAHRFGLKVIVRLMPWLELDAGFQLTYLGRSHASAPRFNVGVAIAH